MKKLNFEYLEVQELGAEESSSLDGGNVWLGFAVAYILAEAVLNPRAHAKAFMEGWNSI